MTQLEKQQFADRLTLIEDKLGRVLHILESDDKTHTKGLVETVHRTKEQVDKMNNENEILKAKAATFGVIGGAVISAVVWFLQKIIFKSL
jgi:septation ring formation regulator EzrA